MALANFLMYLQDQWQKKKQSKEEAKAAKYAKLDPANAKSAKDVMDERVRKRKREEDDASDIEGIVPEKPKEGLKENKRMTKKQKKEEMIGQSEYILPAAEPRDQGREQQGNPLNRVSKVEERREKRERNKTKKKAKAAKLQAKDVQNEHVKVLDKIAVTDQVMEENHADMDAEESAIDDFGKTNNRDAQEPSHVDSDQESSTAPSPKSDSPIFDISITQSGTSSISSIAPPASDIEKPTSIPKFPHLKSDPEELKARLQKRIDELRAARKAQSTDGSSAQTRQELIESRRRSQEQRKAHKKELRKKAKEEEQRQRELTISRGSPLLSSASGSNAKSSPLSDTITEPTNHFVFGQVTFSDGQHLNANSSSLLNPYKRKGPQDPETAMRAAQNRIERLSGLDPEKRADIEEKDVWLNAKKRAHGERARDNTSLLKKTLKRKEKAKKKGEREWDERVEGVKKGQEKRQRKREDNLAKRREGKGSKGKKGGKSSSKGKPKARPGFEGSFRAGRKN